MKVVIDTNVLVSGVFFGGVPGRILSAWREGEVTLVVSPAILDEYRRVGWELATQYEGASLQPLLALIAVHGEVVLTGALSERVCVDPDDDKFLACALASNARVVISGDKALLNVSGWKGIAVVSPRAFVERYLS